MTPTNLNQIGIADIFHESVSNQNHRFFCIGARSVNIMTIKRRMGNSSAGDDTSPGGMGKSLTWLAWHLARGYGKIPHMTIMTSRPGVWENPSHDYHDISPGGMGKSLTWLSWHLTRGYGKISHMTIMTSRPGVWENPSHDYHDISPRATGKSLTWLSWHLARGYG